MLVEGNLSLRVTPILTSFFDVICVATFCLQEVLLRRVLLVHTVVPIAQRVLLSLRQRRQLRRVDVDRVLTAVGLV